MCAAVVGHRVYVLGGVVTFGPAETQTWHMSVIDSKRDFRWTELKVKGDQPTGRTELSCWLHRDSVYFYGGCSYDPTVRRNVTYDEIWRFDIELHEFEKVESTGEKLGKRSCASAGYIESREECVFFGGTNETSILVEEPRCLDMTALKCTIPQLSGDGPGRQSRHGSCVVGETLYIVGGISASQEARSLHLLHCEIRGRFRWSQPKPSTPGISPDYRYNTTLTACGSRLFYLGGVPVNKRTLYFSTTKKTWTVSGEESLPAPRTSSHLSVYVNRKIYCYGGKKRPADKAVWILSAP